MLSDQVIGSLVATASENATFLLAVVALGALGLLILHEWVDPSRNLHRRLTAIGRKMTGDTSRDPKRRGGSRKDHSLASAERLAQASRTKDPDRWKFIMLGGLVGPVVAFLVLLVGGRGEVAVIGGLAMGFGSAWVYRSRLRRFRQQAIVADFPSVIETMVRGLRSGLSLPDTFRLIAEEAPPAIAAEFRRIETERELGLPITEVMDRFAQRVPAEEIGYFATIVNLQSVTGSSLADTLDTLNETLRKRRVFMEKIRIMTADARSSAMILGALPFVVGVAMFFTSNDYISVLYTTSAGIIISSCAFVYMMIGFLIMREMVKSNV